MVGAEAGRQRALTRLLASRSTLDNPLSRAAQRLGLVTVVSWLEAQPGVPGRAGGWHGAEKSGGLAATGHLLAGAPPVPPGSPLP
jgi:hypothetical protein